ncbi:MAG: hypothetical protein ACFCUR_03995 [Rhodomicrobiaceae bacterium]
MASTKVEGEALHIVLQRLREKGEATALDGAEEFEALLNGPRPAQGSIEAELMDYLMPRVTDSSVFQESRAIQLLKGLREIILAWRESPEKINEILRAVDDEINRYQDLLEKRNSGIAA